MAQGDGEEVMSRMYVHRAGESHAQGEPHPAKA